MRNLLVVMCAVLVLSTAGLSPPAAAQDSSPELGKVSTLEPSALSAEDPGQCLEPGQLTFDATSFCWYCDVEYCGCAVVEGCVLIYSCACSSIDCRRSCQYEYCVA